MVKGFVRTGSAMLNGLFVIGLLVAFGGPYSALQEYIRNTTLVHIDPSVQIADSMAAMTEHDQEQSYCLAQNMYFEARSQGRVGMQAVGNVTINRAKSGKFPAGICQVVFQAKLVPSARNPKMLVPARNRCQFTWVCDGTDRTIRDKRVWAEAVELSYNLYLYSGLMGDPSGGATYYKADYSRARWPHLNPLTKIGVHEFYAPRS